MSNQKQKDDLLREHIIQEFGVESEGAEDLLNLIHIVLKTNEKEELSKELREIYEGNIDIDAFVDWVWNLYKGEEEQSPPEETKSEASEQHEKRVNDSITSSIQQLDQPSSNIRSTEDSSTAAKKSRPAIYDEYERMQKVENVRNINNQSKNSEKQKKQPPPGPPETKPSFPTSTNTNTSQPRRPLRQEAPPLPINGKRPHPSNEPKEEPKKSILDRIVKPGEKTKKTLSTKNPIQTQNQTKPKVEIRTSKYEEIVKKVKPNPESNVPPTQAPQKQFQNKPQQPKQIKQTQPTQKPQQQQQPVNQGMMIEDNQDEGGQHGQQQQQQNTGLKKIRCRNWPNCQNEACTFHHPSENCKNFPACSFGNKCLYIHPAINCKFGAFCQRPGCAYIHPRNPMQSFGFGGPGMNKPYKGHANKFPFAGNQGKGHPQTGDDMAGVDQNQGDAMEQENY